MPKFSVIVYDCKPARDYIKATMQRLRVVDVKRNPYVSIVKAYKKENSLFVNFDMVSVYPNIENLGIITFLLMVTAFVFNWASAVVGVFGLITLIFGFIKFSKTKKFHFYVFEKGLKKAGHKGFIIFTPEVSEGWNEPNGYIPIFDESEEDRQ